MQKFNKIRERVYSSSSSKKKSRINQSKILIRSKQRFSSQIDKEIDLQNKKNIRDEYLIQRNENIPIEQVKKEKLNKKRNQSTRQLNKDIEFEIQLKKQIENSQQTLKQSKSIQQIQCQHRYFSLINFSYNKSNQPSKLSIYGLENLSIPKTIIQMVELQQKIKTRQFQIRKLNAQISDLRQQSWWLNIYKIQPQKKKVSQNFDPQRFILADELSQMNLTMKKLITQRKDKLIKCNKLKKQTQQLKKQNQKQLRSKGSDKINLNSSSKQSIISYQQFKFKKQKSQLFKIKDKNVKNKNRISQICIESQQNLQKMRSNLSLHPLNKLQYSNISNISAILPDNRYQIKRQFLPKQVPELPKQKKASIKSMQYKLKTLKQALNTQNIKHQTDFTQLMDKILFLQDEDSFLNEQIQLLLQQTNYLQNKFSYLSMKSHEVTHIQTQSKFYNKKPSKQKVHNQKNDKNINNNLYLKEAFLGNLSKESSISQDRTVKKFYNR